MSNLIQKYIDYNVKVISAPIKFIKNPSIPNYIKIGVVSFFVAIIFIVGTRGKNSSISFGDISNQIPGTYVAENENMGIKQQAELILNKDKTFKSTIYYDGEPSKGSQISGVWKLVVLKDSIFDLGKLKEVQTNNYLECIDNIYHSSSKYKIDLPEISAFSVMSGTTSDILFGGIVNEVPLRKQN